MEIRFWGTRGSLAKPGPKTIRYGGNTSCVQVVTDDGSLLILDCGTGAHDLAQQLQRESGGSPIRGSVLISHTHWDHIQGIPFFAPFFAPSNEWDIYAPQGFGETLKSTLAGQMEYTYFPITPDAFGATIRYHNVSEGAFDIGSVRVRTRFLNHPALTIAYRIEADGAVLVYACDHEPHIADAALAVAGLTGQDEAHSEFLRDADLVIHDAQYTAAEYPAKKGWGHSTFEYAIAACERAGVRQLALTHHDPLRDDDSVDRLVAQAQARLGSDSPLRVFAAAEGQSIRLEASSPRQAHVDPPAPPASDPSDPKTSQTLLVVTRSDDFLARVSAPARLEGLNVEKAENLPDAARACRDAHPPLTIVDEGTLASLVPTLARSPEATPLLVVAEGPPSLAAADVEFISPGFSPEYLRARIKTWLMRGKYSAVPAAIPEDEARRLAALRSLHLLDTPPEERFDRLTRIASKLFGTPISLFTLVDEDRQWFKSRVGLELAETPRHVSFCGHAILGSGPLVVPDALQDERFAGNPLVLDGPRIRFYAGVPVRVDGQAVGTLCLIDNKPKSPGPDELALLEDLAQLVQSEVARGSQPVGDIFPASEASAS